MTFSSNLLRRNLNPSIRTGTPFVRIRVGASDIFTSGDGRLIDATVTLAEGQSNSSCSFTIYDPTREIMNRYFTVIYKNDGLDPLILPQSNKSSLGKSGSRSDSSSTTLENASPNLKAMLDTIAWAEGADYNVAFTGVTFEGTDDHPRQIYCSGSLCSDASGRYQFLSTTWDGLGLSDFSPENQDRGAIKLIEQRGALEAVESGDIPAALESLSYEWASLPPYRYAGQGTKTTQEVVDYWRSRVDHYSRGASTAKDQAADSVQKANDDDTTPSKTTASKQTPSKAKVGQQITIEEGFDGQTFVASSYLHTGLEFDLFSPSTLTFTGQAASFVLARRVKNTAYTNLTFKQLAQIICDSYGLKLNMEEDGPTYEYFPHRGITDYEFLVSECRRIGWRMRCVGNTVTIAPRSQTIKDPGFFLVYGENLGLDFRIAHSAEGDSSGARASDPNSKSTSGERKWVIDPGTGQLTQIQKEETTATAAEGANKPAASTTGNHLSTLAPVVKQEDKNIAANRGNEKRIKGIKAEFSLPTSLDTLDLDPDSVIYTANFSDFVDRIWVVERIERTYSSSGAKTSGVLYTPIKNRYPTSSTGTSSSSGSSPVSLPSGCRGKLLKTALEYEGTDTSAGPGNGNLACVWAINQIFANAGMSTPWQGAENTVVAEEALRSSAERVDASDAQPGDIVIGDDGVSRGHIGIVVEDGVVLSNSSSQASFSWRSDIQMGGSYGSVNVYRLNC